MHRVTGLIYISLIFCCLSLIFSGCLNLPVPYSVSGRVTRADNGQGLGGVKITFSSGLTETITEGNGDWSKEGLKGTVTITPISVFEFYQRNTPLITLFR